MATSPSEASAGTPDNSLSDLFHSSRKVLDLAKKGEDISNHLDLLRKILSMTENCDTAFADKRELFLSISNMLKKNASLAVDSHHFLIRYLATFSIGDETLYSVREESVRAIVEVFNLPNLFLCPWYEFPAVKQLENDPQYDVVHQLLKVFVSQGLDAYLEFYNENSEVLKQNGLVHEECLKKIKLLSLRDICDVNQNFNDVLFSLIEDTLKINEDEVIMWVHMAEAGNLVSCTINEQEKFISVSWCRERSSDLSKWPLIRLKGIDWIEKYPQLSKEVTNQQNRACYAQACAKGVGLLYSKEHDTPKEWMPARQELIDRVIKAYPDAGDERDRDEEDTALTIPISYTYCLDFFVQFGVGLEKNYPYRVKRNLKKSFPPGRAEHPRIFIKGYEWLGSVKDGGEKSMLNIFKGLYKCVLICNITVTSTFLSLETEFYDDTVVVDPKIEEKILNDELLARNPKVGDAHTVVIVELDVTLKRVKILNSWGIEWGKDGKAWVNINQVYDITRVYSSSLRGPPERPTGRYNLRKLDTSYHKEGSSR